VPSSDSIPVFYVKQAKADLSASVTSQSALRQAFDALSPPNLTNFIAMARDTLSLSSGCAYLLFNKICNKNGSEDEDLADSEKFVSFWQAHSVCTPNQVLFRLLVREGRTSITSSDFADIVRYVALTHPGLDFLKATPEFQDRYCECVIEQIIYFNTCDLSHSLSQRDVCNSDLSEAFLALDEEDDINKFTKYFSYQHFYVLYCKVCV
jgi:serine/threonine-protein phosphatase 2A regulatory subunit B''